MADTQDLEPLLTVCQNTTQWLTLGIGGYLSSLPPLPYLGPQGLFVLL